MWLLAADLRVVDERRLRGVVRPLVERHLLLPPLHPAGREVDGDERVGARVRAGTQRRVVERRRGARAEVERVRRGVDRRRRPHDAAAGERARTGASSVPFGRDRPERMRPRRREIGVVRHHEAAHAVLRAGGADDEPVVRADRRARLRVAVVRRGSRHRLRDATRLIERSVAGLSETIVMSSVRMKILPSHRAMPRFATMPKFL